MSPDEDRAINPQNFENVDACRERTLARYFVSSFVKLGHVAASVLSVYLVALLQLHFQVRHVPLVLRRRRLEPPVARHRLRREGRCRLRRRRIRRRRPPRLELAVLGRRLRDGAPPLRREFPPQLVRLRPGKGKV